MQAQLEGDSGKRKWTDLFSSNRLFSHDHALQFISSEEDRVALEEKDVDSIMDTMGNCLVGRFVGRFPEWKAIKAMAKRWNVQ